MEKHTPSIGKQLGGWGLQTYCMMQWLTLSLFDIK